jgi:hypothetical protein
MFGFVVPDGSATVMWHDADGVSADRENSDGVARQWSAIGIVPLDL